MQHKANIALLNSVARATEMGKNTLDQMIPMAEKPEFKAELLKEQRGFRSFNQKAHAALDACGARAEGAGTMEKLMSKAGIAGRTLGDKSTRNMAEMLLEGSQMGVTECITSLRDYPKASEGARQMVHELKQFQEENIETLKRFL